jgi:hypothetical protein
VPLKRSYESVVNGKFEVRVMETFGDWQLDPAVPDGTFTLPKEKDK